MYQKKANAMVGVLVRVGRGWDTGDSWRGLPTPATTQVPRKRCSLSRNVVPEIAGDGLPPKLVSITRYWSVLVSIGQYSGSEILT